MCEPTYDCSDMEPEWEARLKKEALERLEHITSPADFDIIKAMMSKEGWNCESCGNFILDNNIFGIPDFDDRFCKLNVNDIDSEDAKTFACADWKPREEYGDEDSK